MNQAIEITQIDYRQLLDEAEISAIEQSCAHYPDRAAAAIDALQIVQQRRRWIDDQRLYAIADLLQMSAAQLEGVATFYNHIYRQPVGQHVLHLCNSISCWLADYQILATHLQNRLKIGFGQTSADGKITLLPNVCLGCCGSAPALMLDGELVDRVDIPALDRLLDRLLGEPDA